MEKKTAKAILGMDLDGCVCELSEPLKEELRKQGIQFDESTYPWADDAWFRENPDVYLKARPVKGAVDGLKRLMQDFDIVYITRRPAEAFRQTKRWLRDHGIDFPVIVTEDKGKAAKELGVTLAVDDSPEDIRSYKVAGIPCYVVPKPYNQKVEAHPFNW